MEGILAQIFDLTSQGGSIYFMQREKNAHRVIEALLNTGWKFQNLIIWRKMSSAVPSKSKYGLSYQIIVYCIKGDKPSVFNKIRNDPILLINQKYAREDGSYVTDVWDDVRELTSGYFAADEPIKKKDGDRLHKQQSPIHLLLRIILSSSKVGDHIFDPFGGTGTTSIVANALNRDSIVVEKAKVNYNAIIKRIKDKRKVDSLSKYYQNYAYTKNLKEIWGGKINYDYNNLKPQIQYSRLNTIINGLLKMLEEEKPLIKMSKTLEKNLKELKPNFSVKRNLENENIADNISSTNEKETKENENLTDNISSTNKKEIKEMSIDDFF